MTPEKANLPLEERMKIAKEIFETRGFDTSLDQVETESGLNPLMLRALREELLAQRQIDHDAEERNRLSLILLACVQAQKQLSHS